MIMKEYGMRCRKHLCDRSSTVGVCASCIRERLLLVIAHQLHNHHHRRRHTFTFDDDHHSSPDSAPPLFSPPPPQSASPSLNSISTAATWQTDASLRRLYSAVERSTTQVVQIHEDEKKKKKQQQRNSGSKSGKLSSYILGFFRSTKLGKSKSENDPLISDALVSTNSISDSSSWFSNSFLRRRNLNFPAGVESVNEFKITKSDYEDGGSSEEDSSVSYRDWIQEPAAAPGMRRRGGKKASVLGRSGSAMTLCLNPLICSGAGKDRRRRSRK